jgi:hypothetical protein
MGFLKSPPLKVRLFWTLCFVSGLLIGTLLPTPTHAQERREYVRVTYYHLQGTMANGQTVHWGVAACSSGRPGSNALAFPRGSVLEMPDGYRVTCKDTGNGDYYWHAWIDIWTPTGGLGYRDYEWITVVCWGPCNADTEWVMDADGSEGRGTEESGG